jgi:asparagine N-glycosylation enzyme membrane subunit Stt3
MPFNRRTLIIIVALLAIIGVGMYVRSYYIRTDGKYLLAFDPYYHYRMAETIVEQGSRPAWDTIAAYPTGAPVRHPPLFHYYLAYSYLIVRAISDVSLFQWTIYANIIPTILAIIFAYLAGKTLTNEVGGLFTALFMVVNGSIASRTIIGYTDTDIWIVMFSFAVTYFLFKTIKSEKTRKDLVYPFLLGFSLFLFSLTWVGHWHLIILVGGTFCLWFLMDAFRKRVDMKMALAAAVAIFSFIIPFAVYEKDYGTAVILGVLAVAWVLFSRIRTSHVRRIVTPAVGLVAALVAAVTLQSEGMFDKIILILRTLSGQSSPVSSGLILPDVSVSIIQRFDVTFSNAIQLLGALLLIFPLGLAFLLWKRDRFSLFTLGYLGLYLAGTGALLLMGGRYLMLFAIPLVLAGGIFFGMLPEILKPRVTTKGMWAVGFVCALSVVPCYLGASDASQAQSVMDDNLWEALTWIRDNTPEDAVVLSGWDSGYWIESIAKRRTVMNGSQYDIWWRMVKFGKAVETTDEDTAMKEVYGFDNLSEVQALREFPETDTTAETKEMSGFVEDDAYVLISEWTVLTFYWLSYFGNWDYVTGEGKGRIYNPMWIQGARKLYVGTDYIYGDQNSVFSVVKEGENYHSYIIDQSRGYVPTMGTLFVRDGVMYFYERENGELGVIFVPPKSIQYFEVVKTWEDMPNQVFLIKKEDLECMLTRMFFFNGEGLHYFELVKDCGTAKVFKVHKVPQDFGQGVTTVEDTYTPV